MKAPSFIEDHISQIPALQLLMKLGYKYLSPDEALEFRGNRSSNVLLETILKKKLQEINKIEYKGKEYEFSDTNINIILLKIRNLPLEDGFLASNNKFYDLVTLGDSLEQTIQGDKKSFLFRYIDWEHPENNEFHVTEEFSVSRSGRSDTYRPDLVLFINGIPMIVIECKSPRIKHPIDQSIEQHLRNEQEDGIRPLYYYSNLLIGLAVHEAKYATTATKKEFWSVWRERFLTEAEEANYQTELLQIKNAPLPHNERTQLFKDRFRSVLQYFESLEQNEILVTEQDKLLFNLCQPKRLLEIIYHYILFEEGEKKIARYQQYFSVKWTVDRASKVQPDGRREGGVIWHTQGSGKSLTMVMLAQQIALHPQIKNPRIVLVTDRIELDDQITETFRKCHKTVRLATKGASKEAIRKFNGELLEEKELDKFKDDSSLLGYLLQTDDSIITTIVNKFESLVKNAEASFESNNIFVLVDEGHRSHYGPLGVKIRKVFPKACFIAFTGTPLMQKEKNTAGKFGGIIPGTVYTITDAVADKAVVPLLYEGRHNMMQVNERPLDTFFDRVAEPLTDYGKAALKRKFSSRNSVVQSKSFIENTAWDIVNHFTANIQGTGFKGQLVAPNKLSALRYREALKEINRVSVDLLISGPDEREGEEDAFEISDDKVKAFYKSMIDKYGTPKKYEKALINNFKKQDDPEIIIVVDKLLTGFDAPRNQVLYLTRNLREHTLLQAIARVNRISPGKDYGYIIDYYGNLENLDDALHTYSGLEEFESNELEGALIDINKEIEKLPQAHSELWDIFKEIKNKYDEPAYEELLSDESKRHTFYEKLSAYARILKLALSSLEFNNKTPEKQIRKYSEDVKFFLALRISVKRRYSDDVDFREYESQVQKLIDQHITTDGEVLKITGQVNIFDKEERQAELEKITGKAAKADHIASRTLKAISVKMNDDPVHYKKLSELIRKAIEDYHQHRIDEALFLNRVTDYENKFLDGGRDNVPEIIRENAVAIAFYNLASEELKDSLEKKSNGTELAGEMALGIDHVVQSHVFDNNHPVIDWQRNDDIKGKIRISIDDLLFEINKKYALALDLTKVDRLIEECVKVAESRYKSE